MAVLEQQQIPVGTWQVDKVHSTVGFAVKHMVVATFRGAFKAFDANLTSDDAGLKLTGVVQAASVDVADENLQGHLGSPDFFDVERTPEIRFESTDFTVGEDGRAIVAGELTIKGHTEPVEAVGTLSYIEADMSGNERVGLELETVVDRTRFGLNWNAPLPKGGFAVANDVTLAVHLELTKAA
jgi:polyisoprenoid-binding protein YceI